MADAETQFKGSGYGRELIEHALPYQLKAQTRYEIRPDGVYCAITVDASPERNHHEVGA